MIQVEHLTKTYGELTAVNDLSFQIREHSVVGLLGHNGAGKSTTMRMLTGYLAPTAGSVQVMGIDLQQEPLKARTHIGYLPETPPLYPDLTVEEHLRFVCDLRRIPASDRTAEVDRVCGQLQIADVRTRRIRNLSKGYRQRVGFAAALLGSPEFLVLDEPTVGLDPSQVIEIRSLISDLSEHTSILISSHILSEISSVCDSLLMLRRGELVAKGTQEEIRRRLQDENEILFTVIGSEAAVEEIVHRVAPKAAFTMRREGEELYCSLRPKSAADLRGELFRAFAQRSGELTLLSLRRADRSLEELFLEIMQS